MTPGLWPQATSVKSKVNTQVKIGLAQETGLENTEGLKGSHGSKSITAGYLHWEVM